jgi:hypothetical protein
VQHGVEQHQPLLPHLQQGAPTTTTATETTATATAATTATATAATANIHADASTGAHASTGMRQYNYWQPGRWLSPVW